MRSRPWEAAKTPPGSIGLAGVFAFHATIKHPMVSESS